MEWLYTLTGLGVGFIVGLTGVGGGALMTPLLVLGFGVSPSVAVGTDLLYASITKSVGVWVHGRKGTVNWKIIGLLAAGSLPAALVMIGMLKLLARRHHPAPRADNQCAWGDTDTDSAGDPVQGSTDNKRGSMANRVVWDAPLASANHDSGRGGAGCSGHVDLRRRRGAGSRSAVFALSAPADGAHRCALIWLMRFRSRR